MRKSNKKRDLGKTSSSARNRRCRKQLSIEAMENRQLMAVDVLMLSEAFDDAPSDLSLPEGTYVSSDADMNESAAKLSISNGLVRIVNQRVVIDLPAVGAISPAMIIESTTPGAGVNNLDLWEHAIATRFDPVSQDAFSAAVDQAFADHGVSDGVVEAGPQVSESERSMVEQRIREGLEQVSERMKVYWQNVDGPGPLVG